MFTHAVRCFALLALVSMTVEVSASETDELRKRAAVLRDKAAALSQQGKKEAAEKLVDEARMLIEAAERMTVRPRRHSFNVEVETERDALHARLDDLRAEAEKFADAGNEERLERTKRAIRDIMEELERLEERVRERREIRPRGRERGEESGLENRLEHLLRAVDHLNAAGMHELAAATAKRAEEVQDAIRRSGEEHGPGIGPGVIRDLHQAIHRLRDDVNELREEVRELRGGFRGKSSSNRERTAGRIANYYRALDANGNGMLDPNEIEGNEPVVRRIREHGFDPAKPVSVDAFLKARLRSISGGTNRDVPKPAADAPTVSGDGTPKSDAGKDDGDKESATTSKATGKLSRSLLERLQRFFNTYDKNKDGVLVKSEWASFVQRSPKDFDRNGDGKIPFDEFVQGYVATYSN